MIVIGHPARRVWRAGSARRRASGQKRGMDVEHQDVARQNRLEGSAVRGAIAKTARRSAKALLLGYLQTERRPHIDSTASDPLLEGGGASAFRAAGRGG